MCVCEALLVDAGSSLKPEAVFIKFFVCIKCRRKFNADTNFVW